jgi:hypothetical protein
VSTQKAQATAIKAAIQAGLPVGTFVYDADGVPGTAGGPTGSLPPRYVTIELDRRYTPVSRLSGDVMLTPGAVTTHYRAPNVSDARTLRDAVKAALENQMFDLAAGEHIGPFGFDVDGGINYVAEGWSGFDTWTF